ncbi:unnamed protein product [Hymenolepis diminuta]|uniref:ASX DEUBAD domain-containing protein n=1 Tax=Hymenolepis diminuta TaxID=6216 RepID=A0A564YQ36_HYMDI|nr:unnamed protein product [Hymenolepis diminuta]
MGTSLGTDSLMTDLAQQNHSEENQVDQAINTQQSNISLSIEHGQGNVSVKSSQEQIRTGRKRKHIGSLDNFDLELPNSALTKVNLSEIVNMKTFESLPIESRKKLLKLLPIHDQQPPADVSIPSGEPELWIHPTALRNEFFSKALQDYSTRQMNGDFSPRLNSRQGLRKSVGNRQRYSNPISSPPLLAASSSQSTSTFQSPSTTKEIPSNHPSLSTKQSTDAVVKTNGSVNHSNGGRFRNPHSALQTALTKREPMEITEEKESQQTIATGKPIIGSKVDSENGSSQSVPASSSANSTSSDNSSIPPSTAIPPSVTSMTNSCKTAEEGGERQQAVVLRQTATEPAKTQSTKRRLNMPKLESTLLLQNPIHLPQDYRRKSVGTPVSTGRILQQISFSSDSLPSSSASSSRQPLVVDSSSSLSQAQHRTKILADVKKNFIKRKLQQQQQKQSQTSQPSESSVPNQPNPINIRPPGESQIMSSSNNVTPRVISPVLIQPSGNSVSAPATPQHGVNGGSGSNGAIGAIPVPSIFSNYIEAKIVVTPSRSGSSASSNDGNNTTNTTIPDVAPEQHAASAERTSSQDGARQQSITTQNSQIPQQQQSSQSQQLVSPTATVTQQQFLLIPGLNKSHAFLCRTPIPIQPRQTPAPNSTQAATVTAQQPQPSQSVVASQQQQVLRRTSGSNLPSQQQQQPVTNNRPPLILPVSREVTTQQQQQPVPGMYREILPAGVNNGASGANIQRFPTAAQIQPQHLTQVQHQLSPAPPTAFVGAVTPSTLAHQSAHGLITVNMRPTHISATNITANSTTTTANNTDIVVETPSSNLAAQSQAPPASFFQPPPPPTK